jgi:hypothetical protein
MTVYHSRITAPTTPSLVRVTTRHGEELFPRLSSLRDDRSERDLRMDYYRHRMQIVIAAETGPAPTVHEDLQAFRRRPLDAPMAEQRRNPPVTDEMADRAFCTAVAILVTASAAVWMGFLLVHFYH